MAEVPRKRKTETAATRTIRLLSLVSYLTQHDSATISELAEHFSVTEKQIRADIDLLWVTGTPGYMADDLIDFDGFALDHGVVRLTASRGLGSTLRLGVKESIALLAALNAVRSLVTIEFDDDTLGLVDRLISKLSLSLGENARALDIQLTDQTSGPALRVLRAGITHSHPVQIYYANASGVVSDRVIEPWTIFNDSGHLYVQAFCHLTKGARVFRVDRIGRINLLTDRTFIEKQGATPGAVRVPAVGNTCTLRVAAAGRWLTEEIPSDSVEEQPDGSLIVTLDVARPSWILELIGAHADVILSVRPEEYGHEVSTQARSALAAYEAAGLLPSREK